MHSQFSQVFQVTSHIVGFRSVLRVVNFNCCRCTHLLNFLPVREFFVEIHTAKTGLLRCCLYTCRTPRALFGRLLNGLPPLR